MKAYQPWDRITDPDRLLEYLLAAGVGETIIEEEASCQQLAAPDDWWAIVLGTGYRPPSTSSISTRQPG